MDIELNKKNAIAFYKMAYEGNPKKAVELYVGSEYIQHNPEVKDGKKGFIEYFTRMHNEFKDKTIQFIRSVAERDFVALHTYQKWPNDEEFVTMDFFRFDNEGKIVEHWDSIQKIPKTFKHTNKML